MTQPGFPPPYPPPGWGARQADPGPIPLRPLSAGDLLGAGFGVVRRHLLLLGPISVLVAVLSSGATLGILAGTGNLTAYASGRWLDDLVTGTSTGLSVPIMAAAGVGTVLSVVGTIAISGLAAVCAGVDAMGRQAVPGAVAERLAGRVGPLLVTSVVVGLAVSVGLSLIVVPGVLVYVAWAIAAPAAAMERTSVAAALRRSVRLTAGHRGRILGMTLLVLVIGVAIELVISSAAAAMAGALSDVAALILSQAVSAVVSAVTTSWAAAVIALLYIDIRVRRENLGPALRAFAAADGSRQAGGPALGPA